MPPPIDRSLRRALAKIEPRLRLSIFCEGKLTEPRYFHDLRNIVRNPLVTVSIEGTGNDPRVLVQRAVQEKRELQKQARRTGNSFDAAFEVWAVFDVDNHAWCREAQKQAADNGVHVALSNPCFEIFGLYHYTDYDAPVSSEQCQRELALRAPGYAANNKLFLLSNCAPTRNEQLAILKTAIRRARSALVRRHEEGTPNGCPCSGCHVLAERILAGGGWTMD